MYQGQRERSSDTSDYVAPHAWGKRTYVDGGGSVIKVSANGVTVDEAIVIQSTSGFHLADDSDAEVHIISGTSDTNHPYALISIPHTAQRKWKEGSGGVQSPIDGTRAVEVNEKRSYVDDTKFATRAGIFEVDGDTIIIRAKRIVIEGDVEVKGAIKSPTVPQTPDPSGPSAVTVPGFEE